MAKEFFFFFCNVFCLYEELAQVSTKLNHFLQ